MASFTRFKFYEVDINESLGLPDNVQCADQASSGGVALGCADGGLVLLQPDQSSKTSVPAHGGTVHALAWYEDDTIVTLGEEAGEDAALSLTLKVWSAGAIGGAVTPAPRYSVPLFSGGKHAPAPGSHVTAAGLHVSPLEWPSVHVVVAVTGGAVHIVKVDPAKGRASPVGSSPLPSESGQDAVFAGIAPTASATTLWVVTAGRTTAYRLPRCDRAVSSDRGAASAADVALSSGRLAIAGPEVVAFYDADEGQTSALAIAGASMLCGEGEKQLLASGERNLMVATAQAAPASPGPGAPRTQHSMLRVVDPGHKLLAGQATAFCVGTAAGGVLRFKPLPLAQRLAATYRTQAFDLALDLARAEGAPPAVVAEVHRRAGDALYDRRDYPGALEQYLLTMGHLEASYVIQRLLAVQRLENLVTYLERLRVAGLAGPDHTTLLLSCYLKLRDSAKLDACIDEIERAASGGLAAAPHALRAAQACGDVDTALDILTEECGQWREALEAIRRLGRRRAAAAILRHGKGLLEHLPVETTALLMELCVPASTGVPPATPDAEDAAFVARLGDYTHLYTAQPDDLRYACGTILNMGGLSREGEAQLCILLLDLFLSSARDERAQAMDLLRRGWPPGVGAVAAGGDAGLWRDALEHFAALRGAGAEARVRDFLAQVEAARALPPLAVLRALARNPDLRLGLVRDFVARQLSRDDAEQEPYVVQHRWDAVTGAALELPSVHFLCGHSFNASTLGDAGDDEPACPLCSAEQAQAQAVASSNRAWAADKDAFYKKLRASDDGFAVITEYLGKGVLNCTSVSGAEF
ncbi:hypothetical protein QBZ16_002950 [Prototheca wickerhamii]|uniref:Vacuolar protein sorting protein 11 C-terminal domain-containing protein n=1 Tax=Prototheca wickerhamii TaxID=3111 RepID=A0AAD9MHY2_PROWI|nr:hypothetical protein QBZ16_002950 [Prototheca wickerhamii]